MRAVRHPVRRAILPLALLVSACAGGNDAPSPIAMAECPPVGLGASWVNQMPLGLLDSLAFSLPEIEVTDRVIALSSRQENRVLVANRGFTRRVVFGRMGGGPGDLKGPAELRGVPRGLAVLEAGNGRVSFWSLEGAYLGAVKTGGASGGFAVDDRGHVFTSSSVGSAYLRESWDGDNARSLGERPAATPDSWLDLVTRAPDGTLWVFDNAQRTVVMLAPDGRLLRRVGLPPSVDVAVARAVRETDREFRSRGMGGATAALRAFRFVNDGRLFLRTTGEGPFALLVRPDNLQCVALTLPTDPAARDLVRGAYTMTVADDTLFVVSDEGQVRQFPLPPAAHRDAAGAGATLAPAAASSPPRSPS